MSETRNILSRRNNTSKETEVIGSARNGFKNKTEKVLEAKELGSENMVARRVYFVRHGESVEDEKNRELEKKSPQSSETELSETGKKQIQETSKNLQEMGLKKEETLFIYADDTLRVEESLEILLDTFGVSGVINDYRLKTSPKDIDKETGEVKGFTGTKRLLNDLGVSVDTIALMDEILLKDEYKQYKHIVLVGHKSNKAGVKESVENTDRGFQADFEIKNGEILETDISEDRKYVNYEKKRLLQVTSKNYEELKKLFPEIEDTSIIDFQNELNELFKKNSYLYEKILSDNSIIDPSIKLFCLSRLMIEKKFDVCETYIEKILLNDIQKNILIMIFKILYKERKNSYIWKNLLLKIHSQRIDISSKDIEISEDIWHKFTQINLLGQQYYSHAQRNIEDSLDKMVRQGYIINRQISYIRPLSESELKEQQEEFYRKNPFMGSNSTDLNGKIEQSKREYLNVDKILADNKPMVLLANVGEGKSIYLSHLFQLVSLQKNTYTLYYSSKTLTQTTFEELSGDIHKHTKLIGNIIGHKKIVLVFDGIDEIPLHIKEKLKEFLFSNKLQDVKIILGSRKSEYDISEINSYLSVGFEGISLLDKKHFFESRLLDLGVSSDKIEEHILRIHHFLQQGFLNDTIKNTPLVLYFLCTLSKNGRLEKISNRTSLYDEMVHSIFRQFQNIYKEKGQEISQMRDDTLMSILTFCANEIFENSSTQKSISADVMRENIKKRTKISDDNEIESILHKIFLLFRKTDESYVFILESFYEFFLGKALKKKKDGNKIIYDYQKNATNNNSLSDWKKFRDTILFYVDELILEYDTDEEEKNIENIKDLLGPGGLMKRETLFGDNFFLCIENLENIKAFGLSQLFFEEESYFEDMIAKANNTQLLAWFEGFIEFQKRIGYKENRYLDMYLSRLKETSLVLQTDVSDKVGLLGTSYALNLYLECKNKQNSDLLLGKKISFNFDSPILIEMVGIYGIEQIDDIGGGDIIFLVQNFDTIVNRYISSQQDMNIIIGKLVLLLKHQRIISEDYIVNNILFSKLMNIENQELINNLIPHLLNDTTTGIVKIQREHINFQQESNQNIKNMFIKNSKDKYHEVAITYNEYLMLLSSKASVATSSQLRKDLYEKFQKYDKKWIFKYIAKDFFYFGGNESVKLYRDELLKNFLDKQIHDGEKFNFLKEFSQSIKENDENSIALFQFLFEVFFDDTKLHDVEEYTQALLVLLEKNISSQMRNYLIVKALDVFQSQELSQMRLALAFNLLNYTFEDRVKKYILQHMEYLDDFLLSGDILNMKDKTFLIQLLQERINSILLQANDLLQKEGGKKGDKIGLESKLYRLFGVIQEVGYKDFDFLKTLVNSKNLIRKDLNLEVLALMVKTQSPLKYDFIKKKLQEIFSIKEIMTGNVTEYNDFIISVSQLKTKDAFIMIQYFLIDNLYDKTNVFETVIYNLMNNFPGDKQVYNFVTDQVKNNRKLNTLAILAHYIIYQIQNSNFELSTEIDLFQQFYDPQHYKDLFALLLKISPQSTKEGQCIFKKLSEILFESEDLRDMDRFGDMLALQIRNGNIQILSENYYFIDAMNSQQVIDIVSSLLDLPENNKNWNEINSLLQIVQDQTYIGEIIDEFLKQTKYIPPITQYIDKFTMKQMSKLRNILY